MTVRQPIYPISALMRDHYGVLFPMGSIKKSGETIEAAEVQGWFRETYRKVHPNERSVYRVRGADGTAEDLLSTTPDYSRPRRPRTLLSHSGKNREKPSHFNVSSLCAIGIFGVHKKVQSHPKVTPRVNR